MKMSVELSESIKTYINSNGLPAEEILLITFLTPDDFYPVEFNAKEYLIIATEDDLNNIGMDREGSVYILTEEENVYVSNSFIQFVKLLLLYQSLPELPVSCSEKELIQQAEKLKAEIIKIDKSAIKRPEYFWSLIIEQVADGLL